MKASVAIALMACSTLTYAMDEDVCEKLLDSEVAQLMDIASSDYVDPKGFRVAQDEINAIESDKRSMSACETVVARPHLNQKRIRIEGEYLQR